MPPTTQLSSHLATEEAWNRFEAAARTVLANRASWKEKRAKAVVLTESQKRRERRKRAAALKARNGGIRKVRVTVRALHTREEPTAVWMQTAAVDKGVWTAGEAVEAESTGEENVGAEADDHATCTSRATYSDLICFSENSGEREMRGGLEFLGLL
ncbi:hypothetical protein H2201_001535 [Coniosporium apollinis]|uniref:BZIP domain-containing protein n=2 Tax=Coniosporium TaxID=2810619 RepID=A0ABQ9P2A3_9PEZI|nr:hypothetical protein H2199_001065 [Cladosporium sp. JES 115]KAJ9668487.1 hypothetical protein H2201_001535 [Coniosporium apollinis]